jgi:hypothetical protein
VASVIVDLVLVQLNKKINIIPCLFLLFIYAAHLMYLQYVTMGYISILFKRGIHYISLFDLCNSNVTYGSLCLCLCVCVCVCVYWILSFLHCVTILEICIVVLFLYRVVGCVYAAKWCSFSQFF